VLWDLDGTLVDSEQYHWQAWRETMAAEGVTLTFEQFRATFGWRNDAILRQWLGNHADPARTEPIGAAKEERYRALVRTGDLAPLPDRMGTSPAWRRLASGGGLLGSPS
jgi:beta-phosphoglucomutase-like phosphatase (HAD superfamily)